MQGKWLFIHHSQAVLMLIIRRSPDFKDKWAIIDITERLHLQIIWMDLLYILQFMVIDNIK